MFNQMEYDLKQLIYDRPTFQEMYEGYGKGGGSDVPERVTMLYANGDGRTINVGWKKQTDLTNLSHYLLQVSEDKENWYALGFDGEWFSGEPFIGGYYSERFTIVYDHHIAHTRIPYNNGAVRKLYYRVALVTRNGIITGWSDPIQGNTFFVEQDDIRPEGEYVYNMDGSIEISGEALYGTYYVGSGEITSSGIAATEAGFDYVYTSSGSMTTSGTATLFIGIYSYSCSGSMDFTNGDLYGPDIPVEYRYTYYSLENTYGSALSVNGVITTLGGEAQLIIMPSGSTTLHYGRIDSGAIAGLISSGYLAATTQTFTRYD